MAHTELPDTAMQSAGARQAQRFDLAVLFAGWCDVKTGTLRTLELSGVPPPRISPDAPVQALPSSAHEAPPVPAGATLVLSEAAITAPSSQLRLRVQLPPGYHLTQGANSRFEAAAYGPGAAGKLHCPMERCLLLLTTRFRAFPSMLTGHNIFTQVLTTALRGATPLCCAGVRAAASCREAAGGRRPVVGGRVR